MSLARPVYAGDIVHFTHRCSGQLARLRPSKEVNNIVIYCLARAARRHGIEVLAFVFMSNHLHIVLRDPKGKLPLFGQDLHSTLARALNFEQETGGYVFGPGPYRKQTLVTPQSLYKEMAYVMANPVAADCVREPCQWPGKITLPHELGRRTFTAPRPKFFRAPAGEEGALTGDETARERHRLNYTEQKEEQDDDAMLDEESLTLALPPVLPDGTSSTGRASDVRRAAADWLARELEGVHEERRRAGKRGWVGAQKVRRQDPKQPPRAVTGKPTSERNPRFATQDAKAGKEQAELMAGWLRLYVPAQRAWSSGDPTAVFPHGTWLAPRLWGARAHPA